jgi:hypothetical protein
LGLDCLGADRAPFSQGALVAFRERLIAHDLDKRLLDKTVALAKTRGGLGWQHLRAALDSSPLLGAGRIEDTWNLIGRALATVVTCAAQTLRVPREQVVRAAGLTLLEASRRRWISTGRTRRRRPTRWRAYWRRWIGWKVTADCLTGPVAIPQTSYRFPVACLQRRID